ncbi:hemagglutinin repeat-containing protein [Pseudovibrio exalbescens]|uniref:two-partner secretion domain-containing protein n=1 Tax=Pseudovibrio exalbescens TaxID=197461 RepID=UPI00236652DD|nr:hemagglutinin repeat-containing protein [Pseudovibrio exalbescens]MDD7911542.1 hemagglutinin repeat-containing protein [Pseudovibrio exalbescens]
MKKILNALFCCLFSLQGILPTYAQGLSVDTGANAPGLTEAANGVPVVNIVTPDGHGLSHNKFTDFNVGTEGVILNNSGVMGRSELGGLIYENPNITEGNNASLILNEVTSSNRSLLEGPTEVHGPAANYILVNPNGMTCNGCGFINIPRATLSTGTPVFEEGKLSKLLVQDGAVTIGPLGLTAEGTDYFDIVARSIEVNGKIHGGEFLGLYAGRNTYDPKTGKISPNDGSDSGKPEFAIDTAALGGMYAGQIKLVGTEAGVGVRAPDEVVATTGDFTISASGQISLGSVSAKRNITASAQKADITVRENVSVYAEDTLLLKAGADLWISPKSVLAARSDLTLSAQSIFANGADIASGVDRNGKALTNHSDLTFAASDKLDLGATVAAYASGNGVLTADAISQSGSLSTDGDLSMTANTLQISGNKGHLYGGALRFDVAGTMVIDAAIDALQSETDVEITAGRLHTAGDIRAKSDVTLLIKNDAVLAGTIDMDGDLTLSAQNTEMKQSTQIIAGGAVNVDVADLSVLGTIEAQNGLQFTAEQLVLGDAAQVLSGTNLRIDAALLRSSGQIKSAGNLSASALTLLSLETGSYLRSKGALNLNAGNELSIGGRAENQLATVLSDQDLVLTAGGHLQLVSSDASVVSLGSLSATAHQLSVQGALKSSGDLSMQLLGANLSEIGESGAIETDNQLTISAQSDLSTAGKFYGGGAVNLDTAGNFNLRETAQITTFGQLELGSNALKLSGAIEAVGNVAVEAREGTLQQSSQGQILSKTGAVHLTSAGDLLLAGTTQSQEQMHIEADGNVHVAGSVATLSGDVWLEATRSIGLSNDAIVSAGGSLNTRSAALETSGTLSGSDLSIATRSNSLELHSGSLTQTTSGALDLQSAANIIQNGDVLSSAALNIEVQGTYWGAATSNLTATERLLLNAASTELGGTATILGDIDITSRTGPTHLHGTSNIIAGNAVRVRSNGSIDTAGTIETNGLLSLETTAGAIKNTGSIRSGLSSNNDVALSLTAANRIRNDGLFYSSGSIAAHADSYSGNGDVKTLKSLQVEIASDIAIEAGTVWLSGQHTTVSGTSLAVSGSLETAGSLAVGVDTLTINNSGTLLSDGALELTVADRFTIANGATVLSYVIEASAGTIDNGGQVGAETRLSLSSSDSIRNRETGELLSNSDLSLDATELTNEGQINASVQTRVHVNGSDNNALTNTVSGRLESQGQLRITASSVDNRGMFSGKTGLNFTTSGDVVIRDGAVWQSEQGPLSITARNLLNEGALASGQNIVLRSEQLDNDGGLILAKTDILIEGKTVGSKSMQLLNHNGGAIEALEGNITLRTQDLQNLTAVETTVKTYEYANNYIYYQYPPSWLDPRAPGYKGGSRYNNVYVNNGYVSGYAYGTMWDRSRGPIGYIFAPDIVMIEQILADKGAEPEDWDPNWWKEYAPTSLDTFDPFKGHLERWNVLAPDEEHKVPTGGQLIVFIEQGIVTKQDPTAEITARKGSITIDADNIVNRSSNIIADQDISLFGDTLTNEGVSLSRTYGARLNYNNRTVHRGFGWIGWLNRNNAHIEEDTTVAAVPGVISAGGALTGNLATSITNSSVDPGDENPLSFVSANNIQILQRTADTVLKVDPLTGASLSAPDAVTPGLGSLDTLNYGDLDLTSPDVVNPRAPQGKDFLRAIGLTSNAQLFKQAPEGAGYLIETRFEFIDPSGFYGHDYFAETVGIQSVDAYAVSLGDAYFDTRLINDQVLAATDRRWLTDDGTSEADQVRQLMHNAADAASSLDLTYGVALSAEQVALLTKDIVWYEKTVVSGHEVVVPRLYLADSTSRNRSGAIIAGRNISLASADVLNTKGRLSANDNLTVLASNTLTNRSGVLSGSTVDLQAREIKIETAITTTGNGDDRIGSIIDDIASVSAAESLSITSTGDTTIAGGSVSSGGDLTLNTGGDLKVTGAQTNSHYHYDIRNGRTHQTGRHDKTQFVTSDIQAADTLQITSEKGITLEGALVASDGTATLSANDDINITSLEESAYDFSYLRKSGTFSGKTRRNEEARTTQVGSLVTATDGLTIRSSQGSIDVTASALASEGTVQLDAADDIALASATEDYSQSVFKKSHGFFASAGGGTLTVGYKKEKHTFDTQMSTEVVSSVSGETIDITAGNDFTSEAGILNAGEDLSIAAGNDINLTTATDTYAHSESHKIDSIALSIGVFENVSGPVKTLARTPQEMTAGKGNAGYQAVTAVSGALKAAEAAQSLANMAQGGTIAGVRVGIGVSSERSSSEVASVADKTGHLNAGRDITLEAGRDLTSEGTQIVAGRDASLTAGRDLTLEAAQTAQSNASSSSSKSAGIGLSVGIGIGKEPFSVGVDANIAGQKAKGSGQSATNTNSLVQAERDVSLTSGQDTTLNGAQVKGETVTARVGGDLTIESQQDTARSTDKSTGGSLGLSLSANSVGGSVSINNSNGSASKAWVTDQSGIVASGKVDIRTENNTDLTGGLIASESGDLTLDTGTLTHSDIHDHDKASSTGIALSGSVNVTSEKQKPEGGGDNPGDATTKNTVEAHGSLEGTYSARDKRQITRATVGEGEILIRDEDKQQELEESGATTSLASLNRDVTIAQEITRDEEEYVGVYISDEAVRAALQGGKAISEIITNALDRLAQDGKLSQADRTSAMHLLAFKDDPAVLAQLKACGSQRSSLSPTLWDWIIAPAHAQGGCAINAGGEVVVLSPDAAKACLTVFSQTVKYAAGVATSAQGALATALLVAMTTPAGGGQIHEEIAAEGGKLITITGHGDELIRKIIVTYPTGEEVVIRGFVTEQDNGFVVDQGFINGELMPETMLEGMTADLNGTGLNVLNAHKPNEPLTKGDYINLGDFTKRVRGSKDFADPATGYRISKDRAGAGGHGGSFWKLYDKRGNRIATLSKDGQVLRK